MESLEFVVAKFFVISVLLMFFLQRITRANTTKCFLAAIISVLVIMMSINYALATDDGISLVITVLTASFLLALFHKAAFREEEEKQKTQPITR